jgi:hypothetical protein
MDMEVVAAAAAAVAVAVDPMSMVVVPISILAVYTMWVARLLLTVASRDSRVYFWCVQGQELSAYVHYIYIRCSLELSDHAGRA